MGCGASVKGEPNMGIVPGGAKKNRRDSNTEDQMKKAIELRKKKRARRKNIRAAVMESDDTFILPPTVEHTPPTEKLLLDTLAKHWLFSGIEEKSVLRGIVNVMTEKKVTTGTNVIVQKEEGTEFYVLSEGLCSVTVDDKLLDHQLGPGKAFGDLALFYDSPRTATVTALESCILWVLDQKTFRHFLMRRSNAFIRDNVTFLKTVEEFADVDEEQIANLANAMNPMTFSDGEYIIKQGDFGNIFYILKNGKCKVVENDTEKDHMMEKGDYFGERALVENDVRSASIIAVGDVECAGIDKQTFNEILGDYEQFKKLKKGSVNIDPTRQSNAAPHMELSDLKELQVLGVGGFGLVTMVQHKQSKEVYALKKMQKQAIVDADMQQMIVNEKNFLVEMNNPFVLGARGTSVDRDCVYIVLEFLQGGDLFGLLENNGQFDETYSRFYAACTAEALAYVHSKKIVFRDLKLENLVLDAGGYCKLVDFGLAKRISGRTYTVCGSPRYCSPEMVVGKGHYYGVDWWALGIILYEVLFAESPFASDYDDHLETFRNITKNPLAFPSDIGDTSSDALDLIQRLCKKKVTERIGCLNGKVQDVRDHAWFTKNKFEWNNLQDLSMTPPWTPSIKSNTDGSNFGEVDIYEEHLSVQKYRPGSDTEAGWDSNF